MGIILGKLTRRLDLFEKAVKAYNKEPIKNVETTDKEKLKNELINTFDQVDLLLQESAELQMRSNILKAEIWKRPAGRH